MNLKNVCFEENTEFLITNVKLAKQGNEIAFKNLFLTYKDDIYLIARSKLCDEEDIQDAIQETMLYAFKNIKKLKQDNLFKYWIIKILINECKKIYIAKSKKRKLFEQMQTHIHFMETDHFTDDIGEILSFYEKIKILNDKEKNIIIMYYGNCYSCNEISKILNLKENTIKSILKRARDKLKKSYLKD